MHSFAACFLENPAGCGSCNRLPQRMADYPPRLRLSEPSPGESRRKSFVIRYDKRVPHRADKMYRAGAALPIFAFPRISKCKTARVSTATGSRVLSSRRVAPSHWRRVSSDPAAGYEPTRPPKNLRTLTTGIDRLGADSPIRSFADSAGHRAAAQREGYAVPWDTQHEEKRE